jgi:predicted  nucleic acid-binding Zn-ribbon protein
VSVPFDGVTSFRDRGDPFKRFRAVENAYSRFEVLLLQARSKRQTLKSQIARLNFQLKNAKDDAEVQKLAGSLQAAQTALIDLDDLVDTSHQQMESLQVLNENRKEQEEVAADEISRERNREFARLAAKAEAKLPDFNEPNADLPPGF